MTHTDRTRLRDALVEALEVRRGLVLDHKVIQDRANNAVEYITPIIESIVKAALVEAARGAVYGDLIDGARPKVEMTDEDTAIGTVRPPEETAEELARRVIK